MTMNTRSPQMTTNTLILLLIISCNICHARNLNLIATAEKALHSGNLQDAIDLSQRAVNRSPDSARAISLHATALTWSAHYDQAESILTAALKPENNNTSYELHRDLGSLLHYYYPQSDQVVARVIFHYQAYLDAIEAGHIVAPSLAATVGVHNDLALLLQSRGEILAAASHFQRAIKLDTSDYKTRTNYGLLLGKLEAAVSPGTSSREEMIREGISHQREATNICRRRGLDPHDPGRAEATRNLPRLLLNLGSTLDVTSRLVSSHAFFVSREKECMALWREAVSLDANLVLAWDALGNKYAGVGNIAQAKLHYKSGVAAAQKIQDRRLEFSLEIKRRTLLPRIYNNATDILLFRWKFMNNLQNLLDQVSSSAAASGMIGEENGRNPNRVSTMIEEEDGRDPSRAVLDMGYYLVYQGLENRRPREMMAEVYRRYFPSIDGQLDKKEMNKNRKPGPLRVAFFSGYFNEHTTTKLLSNVIQSLIRRDNNIQIQLIIPHAMMMDQVTKYLFEIVGETKNVLRVPGMRDLSTTRQLIRSLDLDVLVFSEIGMGMCAYFLAFAARTLATRSIMFWGHGVTSGIRHGIDFFISSKLFHQVQEKEDVQHSFTEKVWFMDSLTVAFQRPPTMTMAAATSERTFDLARLVGVKSGEPHYYLAPTSLYKFHPLMDSSLASILKQDSKAVIVLVRGVSTVWSDLVVERLRRQFPLGSEHEQARQRIVVVPAMKRSIYLEFLKSGHVVMLPFPTTSANTVFETISVGTPFVSFGGSARYLLQHYAPGILHAMNVSHECCIAASEEEYVRKLLRLGTNATYRREVSTELVEKSELLFGVEMRERVVREWEVMLRNVLEMERR